MVRIPASKRTLVVLAALVWYVGAIILVAKGVGHIVEAWGMRPSSMLAPVVGILAATGGLAKARYLFAPACRKNLARIESLTDPMIWQFYKTWFLFELAFVSFAAGQLSRMSHGNYPFEVFMGALDLGIGFALAGSSHVYLVRRRQSRTLSVGS